MASFWTRHHFPDGYRELALQVISYDGFDGLIVVEKTETWNCSLYDSLGNLTSHIVTRQLRQALSFVKVHLCECPEQSKGS